MGIFGKKKTEDKAEDKKTDAKKGSQAVGAVPKKEKKEEKAASMKELYSQTEAGKEKKPKAQVKQDKKYGSAYRVLVKPLITEKAANLGSQNKYVFEVESKANKIEIAKAVAEAYGVKPIDVNIVNNKGKKARYGRITGRRKDWKKAIVSLPSGQSIKIYEGV